jgi:hypothetical protein
MVKKDVFFHRITQEGGYYEHSTQAQTDCMDRGSIHLRRFAWRMSDPAIRNGSYNRRTL